MGKKKKVKEVKETKTTFIVIGIVGGFLLILLISQAIVGFRRLDLQHCILTMVSIQEAIKTMEEELGFDFDPSTTDDKYRLNSLILYFRYGKDAFVRDDKGYLIHKPTDEIQQMEEVTRSDNYFPEYPECPGGGTYSLIPTNEEGIFYIRCSKHGTLEPPDSKGRYVFDGKFSLLNAEQTAMGWEARIVVPSTHEIGMDTIFVIPATQQKKSESNDTITSPTLESRSGAK